MFKNKFCLSFVLLSALFVLACAFNAPTGKATTQENQQPEVEKNAQSVSAAPEQSGDAQQTSAKGTRFKGSIAQSKFEMTLRREGNNLSGSYYYLKSGSANALKLTGKIDENGKFTLRESDAAGKQTGEFSGVWKNEPNKPGAALEGEWKKPNSKDGTSFWANEQLIFFTDGSQITTKSTGENNKLKRFDISAEYPEIIGGSARSFAGFNQAAKTLVTKSVAEFRKNMMAQTAADLKDLPKDMNSFLDIGYNTIYADNDLISVEFDITEYGAGAAHPNTVSATLNYDLKNGKELKLADLFKQGAKYLETIADYSLKDLQSRTDNGENMGLAQDDWAEGAAPKQDNYQSWNVTKTGMMFTFDPYQVGPYAAGPQTVIVPYARLKDLARADGAITKWMK